MTRVANEHMEQQQNEQSMTELTLQRDRGSRVLGSLDGVHESPVKEATAETSVAHVGRQSCSVWLEGGGIRLRLLECRNSVQKISTCDTNSLASPQPSTNCIVCTSSFVP